MPVIVIAADPDRIVDYLKNAGQEAWPVYANDLAVKVAQERCADLAIYFTDAGPIGHERALHELRSAELRVILVTNPKDDIIPYAVGLGVRDILLKPLAMEKLLDAINNPASEFEAAELMRGISIPVKAAEPERPSGGLIANIRKGIGSILVRKSSNENGVEAVDEAVDIVVSKTVDNRPAFRAEQLETVYEMPADFFDYAGETPDEIAAASPGAIVISSDIPDLTGAIKALRRDFRLSAVPIVILGDCDTARCYAAGADECVTTLDFTAVERIRARAAKMREMWEQAEKDPLTGLFNRRFLEKYLAEQERRYRETGVPFSLLLCDLDHFKAVNDTHGHDAGDAVLKQFAACLAGGVRQTDVAARYGGEEFIIVFPGLDDAREIAQRLCRGWAGHRIRLPGGQAIQSTFSGGLAVMGRDAVDAAGLIKAADEALYRAKEAGRNRVVAVGERVEVIGALPAQQPLGQEQSPISKPNPRNTATLPHTVEAKRRIKLPQFVIDTRQKSTTKQIRCPPEIKPERVLIFTGSHGQGVTSIILAAARALCFQHEVAVIDADFKYPDIGLKMGVPVGVNPPLDWRIKGIKAAVNAGGFYVLPLDPTVSAVPAPLALEKVIREAMELVDPDGLVLIDAGNQRLNVSGTVVAVAGPGQAGQAVNAELVIVNRAPVNYQVDLDNVIGVIPYEAEVVVEMKAKEIFKKLFATKRKGAGLF